MSRSVQLRLFMLVATFMFVLLAIEEARKPKYYEWMWRGSQRQTGSSAPVDGEIPPARHGPLSGAGEDSLPYRIEHDGWSYIVETLTDREAGDLQECLLRLRHNQRADERMASSITHCQQVLGARWNEYLDTARSSLTVPEHQRAEWVTRLDQLHSTWFDSVAPHIDGWLTEGRLTDAAGAPPALPETLTERGPLQAALDARVLQLVRDNTVFVASEAPAWFRLFERLRSGGPFEAPAVSYLQLLHQPKEYRGRAVRISGVVREARRVEAPENALGIEGYNVLWLKPDGANSPLVAYTLDLPAGFPRIADRARGESPTRVAIDAHLTGYFFKLLTYQGHGGVEFAPLLIAATPELVIEPGASARASNFVWVLVLGAMVGGVFVLLLRRWSGRPSRDHSFPDVLDLPAARHGGSADERPLDKTPLD